MIAPPGSIAVTRAPCRISSFSSSAPKEVESPMLVNANANLDFTHDALLGIQ
jgi:hypothetical protein